MEDWQALVNPTRKSLILRTIAGDAASWDRFSRAYRPLLVSYAGHRARELGLSWSKGDVEDVAQDIFLNLLRTMPKFAYDPARRFRSYLYECTINAIYERLRKRRPLLAGGDEPLPDPPAPPKPDSDVIFIAGYFLATLGAVLPEVKAKCLATGNEKKWTCFVDHALGKRPAAEVAAELGISKELVYQNAFRVLKEVHRLCLGQYEADFGGDDLLDRLSRLGPGALTDLCADILGGQAGPDSEREKLLAYFRGTLREHLPGLRAKVLATAPDAWAAFERLILDRLAADEAGAAGDGDAPIDPDAARILGEIDRLCRDRCEADLGDREAYARLSGLGPDILADLCVGLYREGFGHGDAGLPG